MDWKSFAEYRGNLPQSCAQEFKLKLLYHNLLLFTYVRSDINPDIEVIGTLPKYSARALNRPSDLGAVRFAG